MFSATRSSEIIDIVHAHGLCVSYDRLRRTQGLGEAFLQLFHDNDVVIPGLLWAGLFMAGAKDSNDKSS